MDVTETLSQLTQTRNPLNVLSAMTGATNFINHSKEGAVSFRFKGSKEANYVKISLNGNDLYDVDFIKIWGMNLNKQKVYNDVYNDQLKELFESHTGLYLSF